MWQAHGIISQRNQFCACDVARTANCLIALFVMMPVFYVAGNELILSLRCFFQLRSGLLKYMFSYSAPHFN